MTTVESVANEIIRQQQHLTTWKLQKLTFYAHAIHLVRHGKPLFEDQVEAFNDGPVVRSLYNRFRGRRNLGSGDLISEAAVLTPEAAESVAEALKLYGHQSADWLRFQAHIESPWIDGRAKEFPEEQVITNEELLEFYRPVFDDLAIAEAMVVRDGEVGMTSDDIRARYAEHLS